MCPPPPPTYPSRAYARFTGHSDIHKHARVVLTDSERAPSTPSFFLRQTPHYHSLAEPPPLHRDVRYQMLPAPPRYLVPTVPSTNPRSALSSKALRGLQLLRSKFFSSSSRPRSLHLATRYHSLKHILPLRRDDQSPTRPAAPRSLVRAMPFTPSRFALSSKRLHGLPCLGPRVFRRLGSAGPAPSRLHASGFSIRTVETLRLKACPRVKVVEERLNPLDFALVAGVAVQRCAVKYWLRAVIVVVRLEGELLGREVKNSRVNLAALYVETVQRTSSRGGPNTEGAVLDASRSSMFPATTEASVGLMSQVLPDWGGGESALPEVPVEEEGATAGPYILSSDRRCGCRM